jgi:hypothetical protein
MSFYGRQSQNDPIASLSKMLEEHIRSHYGMPVWRAGEGSVLRLVSYFAVMVGSRSLTSNLCLAGLTLIWKNNA